jgi:hypothetical protein
MTDPDPRILRIEFLDVEQPPLIDSNRVARAYEGLSGDFGEALDSLIAAVDNARCNGCTQPIGYHCEYRHDDRVTWRPVTLARAPIAGGGLGPIVRLCEACAPDQGFGPPC